MLTSPLPTRLLESLAQKMPSAVAYGVAFEIGVRLSPDSGARPPHGGDAGRDNPDAWVPATQLNGHNEQV